VFHEKNDHHETPLAEEAEVQGIMKEIMTTTMRLRAPLQVEFDWPLSAVNHTYTDSA
jgi:hypothetical protein